MGSISEEDYKELQEELEDNFLDIVFLNKYKLLEFIKRTDLYYEYAIVPIGFSNNFTFISRDSSNNIHFLFGHYILKEVSLNQLRKFLIKAFRNKIGNAIKPLQRKWKEYYYRPDGPFIIKHLEDICNRNGFMP